MKKLLLFAGSVLIIAICVFLASRAYSDWKLRGILFESFGNVAELKKWEYSTVSYNYFTKRAVVSGLQFFLANGGYLYIGKISGMLEAADNPASITLKDISYSNGESIFAASSISCAKGSFAELAGVKWSELNFEPRSTLIGRWGAPAFNFDNISIDYIEYKDRDITVKGGDIYIEYKKGAYEELYSIGAEKINLLISGKALFSVDNISDKKSYNADKNTHEEFLTVHAQELASISLHYTQDIAANKLKVLRLSYIDRSFLYNLSALYKIVGGSITQENQWLLTETFSNLISNIVGGELVGKLELMEEILNFFEKPERFDLDIDGEGNTKLSLNGGKPIYIVIESTELSEEPIIAPNDEINEFEAGEGEESFNEESAPIEIEAELETEAEVAVEPE